MIPTRRFRARRSRWWLAACLVLLPVVFGACGGDDGTAPEVDRVAFEPPPGDLTITAADDLVLRVLVDGEPVPAVFAIDGEDVASGTEYHFVPDELGGVTLTARTTVDGVERGATWNVEVGERGLRVPPVISVFEAGLAPVPGGISLVWERPATSRVDVEIVAFDIAYADRPFGPEEFDDVEGFEVSVVPDGPLRQRQQVEGLVERRDYTFRIRARDRVGRLSEVSEAVTSPATGSYRFQGIVRSLRPDGRPVEPLPNVVVNVGDRFEVTEEDGRFDLSALPDTGDVVLRVAEQSGFQYVEIETDPIPAVDREFDLVLVQNGIVEYVDGGDLEAMTRLEFLKILVGAQTAQPGLSTPLFTWAEYPIPLYVHPYVYEAEAETIDYAAEMITSAEAWNEMAGETLFEVVRIDEPFPEEDIPMPGVVYKPDSTLSIRQFGNAQLISPPGGTLFRVVPEIMAVRVFEDFNTAAVTRKVAVHELGHVLGLRHDSPANIGVHVMIQSVTTDSREVPQDEEALAARFVRHAAGKVEMQWYREPSGLQE